MHVDNIFTQIFLVTYNALQNYIYIRIISISYIALDMGISSSWSLLSLETFKKQTTDLCSKPIVCQK